MINILKEANPTTVLDVATGTGDVALEISKQIPGANITGLDLSNKMLEIGRKKVAKKNLQSKIKLEQGDSENLPYQTGAFDALTVAFGVRNYENLEKGLEEMLRVIRKDGKVVILEFSKPTMFPFKQIFNLYFKFILPVVGKMTSKDPKAYEYLFESVQSFPYGAKFVEVLERSGYKNVTCKPLTLGICSLYVGYK